MSGYATNQELQCFLLDSRKHLDMVDDEKWDWACLQFQFKPELLLDGS
jgi:hypothetical protein